MENMAKTQNNKEKEKKRAREITAPKHNRWRKIIITTIFGEKIFKENKWQHQSEHVFLPQINLEPNKSSVLFSDMLIVSCYFFSHDDN